MFLEAFPGNLLLADETDSRRSKRGDKFDQQGEALGLGSFQKSERGSPGSQDSLGTEIRRRRPDPGQPYSNYLNSPSKAALTNRPTERTRTARNRSIRFRSRGGGLERIDSCL